jgi:uncharacterized protein
MSQPLNTSSVNYWHKIKINGVDYLFNAITKDISKKPKNLNNLETSGINLTEKAGRLVIKNIFLMVSLDCNQSCKYCLCKDQPYSNKKIMTWHTAKKAIDLLAHEDNKSWQQITFYGGEPLINYDVIKKAAGYARRLQKDGILSRKLFLVLNTNGLLITDEIARFLKKYEVEVQLSFDGIYSDHNINRVLKNGDETFSGLEVAIDILNKYEVRVVPMVTVTEQNLINLKNSLMWLTKRIKFDATSINLVLEGTLQVKKDFGKRAAAEIFSVWRWLKQEGIKDYNLEGLFENFGKKTIPQPICGATTSKIAILPSGQILACQSLGIRDFNMLGKDSSIDETKRKVWSELKTVNRQGCHRCIAFGVCGGTCLRGSYTNTGSLNNYDKNSCDYMRNITKKIIIYKLGSGGV